MSAQLFLLVIPMALLTAAFLWTGEVRAFRGTASHIVEFAVAGAFLALGLLPSFGVPQEVWFGVAALPFAAGAAKKLAENPGSRAAIVPARQMMLQSMIIFAVAVAGGVFVSSIA